MRPHTKPCVVYKKVYQALTDSPARHEQASITCYQARKYNIDENLSVWQIIDKINQKNADLKRTYDQRGDNSPPSTQNENPGVKDRTYNLSTYPDKASCVQDLVSSQNLSLAVATSECKSQFGPGEGTVSGKARKAILSRITKQYPHLSRQSAEAIVNEAIRESEVKANINKSKKTVSGLQANSRHVYAARLENHEIPPYLVVQAYQSGAYDLFEDSRSRNLLDAHLLH